MNPDEFDNHLTFPITQVLPAWGLGSYKVLLEKKNKLKIKKNNSTLEIMYLLFWLLL